MNITEIIQVNGIYPKTYLYSANVYMFDVYDANTYARFYNYPCTIERMNGYNYLLTFKSTDKNQLMQTLSDFKREFEN